jgi:hypothetical protein
MVTFKTNMNYFSDIEYCGDNYETVIDSAIKNGVIYKQILGCFQFINKSRFDACKYFLDKYMSCAKCRKEYAPEILCTLAMSPPSKCINKDHFENDLKLYKMLLHKLFQSGVYPDQVCMAKYEHCDCEKNNKHHICNTTPDCICRYHCQDTSFFKAIWMDCNYDFINIALMYINPQDESVLFNHGNINKPLLQRYIKFLNGSDDAKHDHRCLKLVYEFYVTNCDPLITFQDFKNNNLDNKEYPKRSCSYTDLQNKLEEPKNSKYLETIHEKLQDIEKAISQLKDMIIAKSM